MSMEQIDGSIFNIKPLNDGAYELKVQFLNKEKKHISDQIFTFCQKNQNLKDGKILDVYSQNGFCRTAMLKNLFKKRDLKGVEQAAKKLASPFEPKGPVVCVLDIKGMQKSYQDPKISKCEKVVCDFFHEKTVEDSQSPIGKKIHGLFQKSHPLDFVICEGSLKSHLLKKFTDKQVVEYLQSKSGSKSFCQVAEFFMNGFKFGQEASDIKAKDYIKPVSSKFDVFHPYKKSTVWYPVLYKDLYSPQGVYAKALNPIFSVKGSLDENSGITTVNVEKK